MNTYSKFCPNVFLAKCEEQHEKGEVITMTTRHGKQHEAEVFNFIYEKDGFYYYSIVRTDGTNSQTRAEAKAERYTGYAANAAKRSSQWHEKATEGRDFLILGEPIKVGHHSEQRHRNLIERNWNRMRRAVEEADKIEGYEAKAEYWERKAKEINLSMPESIEYFEQLLKSNKEYHQFLKDNPSQRPHSLALGYANKAVKTATKNLELAKRLWAED